MTKSIIAIIGVTLTLISARLTAQELPKGFQEPEIIKAVMDGRVHKVVTIDKEKEQKLYLRSYFNKVSPDAYVELATNYEKYPKLFREIQAGRTVNVNNDKSVFEYYMDIVFSYRLFPVHVYPEGVHTVKRGATNSDETVIEHILSNYTEAFEQAKEVTRLIPYETGMLVEDEIHVILKEAGSSAESIKNHLVNEFSKFMVTFRQYLKGDK